MKRQLLNTIYGLTFAMEKNDFERLKSSKGKKRNDFFSNPIYKDLLDLNIKRNLLEYSEGDSIIYMFNFFEIKIDSD